MNSKKIVPIGHGYPSAKSLLGSMLEKADEIEWIGICWQNKGGIECEATNSISLAEIALIALAWQNAAATVLGAGYIESEEE